MRLAAAVAFYLVICTAIRGKILSDSLIVGRSMQPATMTASKDIQPVPANTLPAIWPTLQEGLESIRDKADPDLNFDLIHQRLADSEAFLFLTPEGFFILLPLHGRIPSVLVWQAYAEGQGAIRKYLPAIEQLARNIGAHQIEFKSTRPGYRRVFHDWQRTGQRYTRRLI